jgi:hypothetical protein
MFLRGAEREPRSGNCFAELERRWESTKSERTEQRRYHSFHNSIEVQWSQIMKISWFTCCGRENWQSVMMRIDVSAVTTRMVQFISAQSGLPPTDGRSLRWHAGVFQPEAPPWGQLGTTISEFISSVLQSPGRARATNTGAAGG